MMTKSDAAPDQIRLRILSTSDVHLHLLAYDYQTDRDDPAIGLERAARLIHGLRSAAPACVLFDCGDFLQGNLMSDWLAQNGGLAPGDLHPAIDAMNTMRYDAATLGNHDFNYGLPFLRAALAGAAFPVVNANLHLAGPEGTGLLRPAHTVIERRVPTQDGGTAVLRIGVIGFSPPQTGQWDAAVLNGGIEGEDIVTAARRQLPALLAEAPDLVVALCHSGIGPERHTAGMEHAAVPLARIDGIDVILAGHSHGRFPGPDHAATAVVDPVCGTLHGKPATLPGYHASHVGVVDIDLARRPDGRWRPVAHETRLMPVADLPIEVDDAERPADCDPAALATVVRAHERAVDHNSRSIGRTGVALTSYFAAIGPDGPSALQADALRDLASRVGAETGHAALPILASVAPMRAGGMDEPGAFIDIPPGPVTMRHLTQIYGYPNTALIALITGAEVLAWLTHAARWFSAITPGQTDQPLLDPAVPCYNFDVLHGLDYEIDPAAQGDARIRDLRFAGRTLGPADLLVVATNSFRAAGGGGYGAIPPERILYRSDRSIRDIIADHLSHGEPVRPQTGPLWRFAARPCTAAWFDTSPRAGTHIPPALAAALTDLGPTATGFQRYSLRF